MRHATILFCLAIAGMVGSTPALACTQRGSEMAYEARLKGLIGKKRVEGKFVVERVVTGSEAEPYPAMVYGTLKSKRGKKYPIEQLNDGAIILCATFFPAHNDAEGVFYIARNGHNSWRIIHTDRVSD